MTSFWNCSGKKHQLRVKVLPAISQNKSFPVMFTVNVGLHVYCKVAINVVTNCIVGLNPHVSCGNELWLARRVQISFTYFPTLLNSTYPPTYLPTYLPTFVFTYLLTYLPIQIVGWNCCSVSVNDLLNVKHQNIQ